MATSAGCAGLLAMTKKGVVIARRVPQEPDAAIPSRSDTATEHRPARFNAVRDRHVAGLRPAPRDDKKGGRGVVRAGEAKLRALTPPRDDNKGG